MVGTARGRAPVALVAMVVLILGGSLVVPAAGDPGDQQRLEQLAREKQELERAVQIARQNAERYRQSADRFQSAVDEASARIAGLAAEQARAQNAADVVKYRIAIAEEQLALVAVQLGETQALVGSLQAQAGELTRQLAVREQVYAAHLRATYVRSRIGPLEMLLSSRSLADFVSQVNAMILISRQDRQLVGEIRRLRSQTEEKRAQAAEREQEMAGLRRQIETQRAGLARETAEYERLVRAVQASIDVEAGERADVAAERDRARSAVRRTNDETAQLNRRLEQTEAAYAALAADLAARSGLATFNGRMDVWPLSGVVTSGFGPRWGGFHNGLDIAAPMYTPVRAAAAGQVVTVGKPYLAFGDTATVVIIAHGSNFSTLYGHLDDWKAPRVKVGQFVTAGTVIGYVGMTGWTTGPHVHFTTIVDGRAVDPRPYLP
ncbi:MAG: peptidoglycan DD-metalloendopeptidase family protein [Elusimicrobia bacterium]|nr:peptidoglycan DD-metalloendopeptidase family protein [Elusimicrobiota bacterium]